MKPVVLLLVAVISSVLKGDLCCPPPDDVPPEGASVKSLVFPSESSTSYVEMVPLKPLKLTAFTLCMQVATELTGSREIILFAYRTQSYDELNVWRESDGRYARLNSGFQTF